MPHPTGPRCPLSRLCSLCSRTRRATGDGPKRHNVWVETRSLARRYLWLIGALLLVEVALMASMLALDSRRYQHDRARVRCTHIAQAVALSPVTRQALVDGAPSPDLTAYARDLTHASSIDFITVMDSSRVRYSHPDPAQVGKTFIGDLGTATQAQPFTQQYSGTLGPSMRAVVPVMEGGRIIGYVAAGVTIERIQNALPTQLGIISGLSGVLLVTGLGGALLVARQLRRETHGLGATELASMYEYHDSMLHAVREGLLLLDRDGTVQLCNVEGMRLLGLEQDPTGRGIGALGLTSTLVTPLLSGTMPPDQVLQVGERILVVNQQPASFKGRRTGSVVTFRDHTELQSITGELATVRGLTETLRAQNHEAANRLHTVVSLIEMGDTDQAAAFATEELADRQAVMGRIAGGQREPIFEALLLGKMAQAREAGIELVIDPDSHLASMPISPSEAVTVVGNLLDNAFEAVRGCSTRRVEAFVQSTPTSFVFELEDSGPGVPAELRDTIFTRGWTSKADDQGHGLGLALVAQVVHRHGGTITCGSSELGGALFSVDIDAEDAAEAVA
ncbi:sensor histidine kinase regulating citrate/malate metabolism [Luteococcus japonicus]|uniref:histidine kinase n=1 Tax=Luteococcus japonicus TaxID=33984 RepID=A0A3N1ZUU6_9ACTN|nr:sensor histidine kinase regulating citrate/malate metabolism [Luteococcus japonicus]